MGRTADKGAIFRPEYSDFVEKNDTAEKRFICFLNLLTPDLKIPAILEASRAGKPFTSIRNSMSELMGWVDDSRRTYDTYYRCYTHESNFSLVSSGMVTAQRLPGGTVMLYKTKLGSAIGDSLASLALAFSSSCEAKFGRHVPFKHLFSGVSASSGPREHVLFPMYLALEILCSDASKSHSGDSLAYEVEDAGASHGKSAVAALGMLAKCGAVRCDSVAPDQQDSPLAKYGIRSAPRSKISFQANDFTMCLFRELLQPIYALAVNLDKDDARFVQARKFYAANEDAYMKDMKALVGAYVAQHERALKESPSGRYPSSNTGAILDQVGYEPALLQDIVVRVAAARARAGQKEMANGEIAHVLSYLARKGLLRKEGSGRRSKYCRPGPAPGRADADGAAKPRPQLSASWRYMLRNVEKMQDDI